MGQEPHDECVDGVVARHIRMSVWRRVGQAHTYECVGGLGQAHAYECAAGGGPRYMVRKYQVAVGLKNSVSGKDMSVSKCSVGYHGALCCRDWNLSSHFLVVATG